jgi:hypothetical protein
MAPALSQLMSLLPRKIFPYRAMAILPEKEVELTSLLSSLLSSCSVLMFTYSSMLLIFDVL